ncbi:MAG: moaA [Anaerolineales bacterium]|jgi:cyclic pyranopterin phosphate synthase|nr:moaA [Anaerolineales bacterium]MBM2849714.1 moaA [Anaerolineales bacterium]
MALDRFGRDIHYLRISLTDRCNLRCVYCMPEDMQFRPRKELMQDDELLHLVRLFTELGFHKFRLTGGEPTVRANIVELVRGIARAPGVRSLSMTTNGLLLKQLARPLAEAGLQRVNVSIDSLDPAKFKRLTRWGDVQDVWEGIVEAEAAGLAPMKLNAVIVRGYNEDDVADLAALTLYHDWQVRFIEMMPFGEVAGFQQAQVVAAREMRAKIEAALGTLIPVDGGKLDGEARLYRLADGLGDVGFISSVTEPFCASCTRARLTADGKLRMCLLREYEVDLLTPLRQGATIDDLKALINKAVWHKPWGHGLAHNIVPMNRVMSEIGG